MNYKIKQQQCKGVRKSMQFLAVKNTLSCMNCSSCNSCSNLSPEFTLMGNMLVNPVMLRKIVFSESPRQDPTATAGGQFPAKGAEPPTKKTLRRSMPSRARWARGGPGLGIRGLKV